MQAVDMTLGGASANQGSRERQTQAGPRATECDDAGLRDQRGQAHRPQQAQLLCQRSHVTRPSPACPLHPRGYVFALRRPGRRRTGCPSAGPLAPLGLSLRPWRRRRRDVRPLRPRRHSAHSGARRQVRGLPHASRHLPSTSTTAQLPPQPQPPSQTGYHHRSANADKPSSMRKMKFHPIQERS